MKKDVSAVLHLAAANMLQRTVALPQVTFPCRSPNERTRKMKNSTNRRKAAMAAIAGAALFAAAANVALAAGDTSPSPGYLIDSSNQYVKSGYGLCWRTGYWTPAMAVAECDPDLVKKEEPKKVEAAPAPAPAPAPMSAPAPMVAVGPEKPAFEKITLQAETLFDFDKAVVRPDGKKILEDDVVTKMKQYPQVEVVLVSGHADRIGTEKYNMNLSQRRADAVKEFLVAQGVDAGRINTAAKGEAEPVVSCSEIKGKEHRSNKKLVDCLQPNRRVVVEVEVQRPTQR